MLLNLRAELAREAALLTETNWNRFTRNETEKCRAKIPSLRWCDWSFLKYDKLEMNQTAPERPTEHERETQREREAEVFRLRHPRRLVLAFYFIRYCYHFCLEVAKEIARRVPARPLRSAQSKQCVTEPLSTECYYRLFITSLLENLPFRKK